MEVIRQDYNWGAFRRCAGVSDLISQCSAGMLSSGYELLVEFETGLGCPALLLCPAQQAQLETYIFACIPLAVCSRQLWEIRSTRLSSSNYITYSGMMLQTCLKIAAQICLCREELAACVTKRPEPVGGLPSPLKTRGGGDSR